VRARKTNKYPIPTRVQVGDNWYTVDRAEVLPGCRGECDYASRVLSVAARSASYAYTSAEQFNTFWHELTHAILKDMGSVLESDEKFVSAFADRLTNAITSAKFKE
jgi:hypothetical protein